MKNQNEENIILRMLYTLKPFNGIIYTFLGLVIIENILALVFPYFIGKATDVLVSEQPLNVFFNYVLLAGITIILTNIFTTIMSIFEDKKITFNFDKFINLLTINKILTFSIGQLRNENSGLTQSVVNRGQGRFFDLYHTFFYAIVPSFVKTTVSVIAILLLDWRIGLIVLIGIIIFAIISNITNKSFMEQIRESRDLQDEMNKNSTEIIRFTSHITLNSEDEFSKKTFIEKAEKYLNQSVGLWVKFDIISIFKKFCVSGIRVGVFLLSGYLVYKNEISIGEFIMLNMWINMAVSELGFLARMQRRVTDFKESVRKYYDFLDSQPAIINDPKIERDIIGEIEFNDVTFEYPTEKIIKKTDKKEEPLDEKRGDALKNISFKVHLGEKLAIVGKSGSGKSTIINLLCRGYDPQSGQILIDGYDLKDYNYKKYRMNLGVVEQDVVLLDRTLKENLLFGIQDKDSVTDEQLLEVCKQATLSDLIDKLPQKLETRVGERGVKLSGGEKQRVGIARALLRNPKILIFDEATSHLDPLNEGLIKESIDKASEGRTTIIIAHRLSTVLDADKIIVMNAGKLIDMGSHTELLEKCEIYRDLVNSQIID